MLSFVVDTVHFLLAEYKGRWINVVFLQDKHNINSVS